MSVLLAEHSFDCNLCHVVARHGCAHQHGRDRIEINHSRFCGAKIVLFSGSVVRLIAHIPFCAWQSVELVFWAVCCESPQKISDDWLWIRTIKFGDHSLASRELDLGMFCIAIPTRTLSSHAFIFLVLSWRGLSLTLLVWCSDINSADITLVNTKVVAIVRLFEASPSKFNNWQHYITADGLAPVFVAYWQEMWKINLVGSSSRFLPRATGKLTFWSVPHCHGTSSISQCAIIFTQVA